MAMDGFTKDMNIIQQRDKTASFPNIYTVLPLMPETANENEIVCSSL